MDRCLICHRKLKNKESQERGIGPTCFRRVMKVVTEDKKRKMASRASCGHTKGKIEGQVTFFDVNE